MNIVFMGTPDFAVDSLKAITDSGYHVAAVVTAPDKPAGRGLKLKFSPVKEFALQRGIRILQPLNLKSNDFYDELAALKPDVQVVVAFRMLPELIWKLPPMGTFNLHASLLPEYRGAAPINWAIINGESETGLTTFFLNREIDKGNIIFRRKLPIFPVDNAGSLHDRMKTEGALLVLETLEAIAQGSAGNQPQDSLIRDMSQLKPAPKIFKEDCNINWTKPAAEIRNLIRGLSPYPGAYTTLYAPNGDKYLLKIYNADITDRNDVSEPGAIDTDGKSFLKISATEQDLLIRTLQMEGKKKMDTEEFLRGFSITRQWKTLDILNKNEG